MNRVIACAAILSLAGAAIGYAAFHVPSDGIVAEDAYANAGASLSRGHVRRQAVL